VSDPTLISSDQVRAAYDALGLDPDRYDLTREIVITAPGTVVVYRFRRGTLDLTETTEIRVSRYPTPPQPVSRSTNV
jgi:hypothetical protein